MDYEFTNELPAVPDRDILAIRIADAYDLPDAERQALRYKSIGTSDIKSLADLKRRIAECVHMGTLLNTPPRLATLNRRFSKQAKRFETSVLSIIAVSPYIMELERNGVRALIALPLHIERSALPNVNIAEVCDRLVEQSE